MNNLNAGAIHRLKYGLYGPDRVTLFVQPQTDVVVRHQGVDVVEVETIPSRSRVIMKAEEFLRAI